MPAASDDGTTSKPKPKTSREEPWDPAAKPAGGPSLRDEEDRQFHATHFTADPRGAGMQGKAPPSGRRKQRGGTPPAPPDAAEPAPAQKRRGGSGRD